MFVFDWIRTTPRRVFAAICIICLALLAFGLYLQHVVGLEPCPMCIVQRYAMVLIAFVSGLTALVRGRAGQVVGALIGLLFAGGILFEYAWQRNELDGLEALLADLEIGGLEISENYVQLTPDERARMIERFQKRPEGDTAPADLSQRIQHLRICIDFFSDRLDDHRVHQAHPQLSRTDSGGRRSVASGACGGGLDGYHC